MMLVITLTAVQGFVHLVPLSCLRVLLSIVLTNSTSGQEEKKKTKHICHLLPPSFSYTGPVRNVGRCPRQHCWPDQGDQTTSQGWSLTVRCQICAARLSLTRSDTWQRLWAFLWRLWRAGRTPSPHSNDESGTSSHLKSQEKPIQGHVGVLEPIPATTGLFWVF